MILVEVLLPDQGRKLYVSVKPRTQIGAIGRRICKVIDPIGEEREKDYKMVNLDDMCVPDSNMTVAEAGLFNGSRLLFVKDTK